MFEIACNQNGLLEGRHPTDTEAGARALAQTLADHRGEAFQLWDDTGMIDVIVPGQSMTNMGALRECRREMEACHPIADFDVRYEWLMSARKFAALVISETFSKDGSCCTDSVLKEER